MNINDIAAFPRPSFYHSGAPAFSDAGAVGMSLRDWFAGQAVTVASELVADGYCGALDTPTTQVVAIVAYELADAMLKAREAGS